MAADLPNDVPTFPYLRLAAVLRKRAADLNPHDQMPSVTALCQEFGLSPKTVRKATRLLEAEGVIYVIANLGTFVARRD